MITARFLLFATLFSMWIMACKGKPVRPQVQAQVSDTFPSTYFIPAPHGHVNDFDSLFTSQQRISLDSLLSAYDTAEIVIATVDSTYFQRGEIEDFSLRLFNAWGVGDAVKNNGILVCICLDYRQLRIQNGLGIEKIITNEETKKVIDEDILPSFKAARFYEGVTTAIDDLKRLLRRNVNK